MDRLKGARPSLPDGLDGRDSDKWEPLIAIADVIGGDYGALARAAAVKLSGARDDDAAPEIELLSELRILFADRERLGSKEIVEALTADPASRWTAYGRHGKPISERQIANLLHRFGIYPASDGKSRGYRRSDCEESFSRYISVLCVKASEPSRGEGENELSYPSEQKMAGASVRRPTESMAINTLGQETTDGCASVRNPSGSEATDTLTHRNPHMSGRKEF
jgi:Protein of unknown function (DUF3631)